MGKPTWKSFAENLKSNGQGSSYDRRLPAGAVNDGLGAVQCEVLEEMSAALCRAAKKIREALVELARIDDAIREASDQERRQQLVERFNALRSEAYQARRNYLIQREAIGFFRNDEVFEEYPIPPKRSVVGPHGEDGTIDGCGVE